MTKEEFTFPRFLCRWFLALGMEPKVAVLVVWLLFVFLPVPASFTSLTDNNWEPITINDLAANPE